MNDIITKYINDLTPEHNYLKRYIDKVKPHLDDVRFGYARVNTRGYIKWIKCEKLSKKQRKRLGYFNIGISGAKYIKQRLSETSVCRRIFCVEPV
jgi:hypothetical protein